MSTLPGFSRLQILTLYSTLGNYAKIMHSLSMTWITTGVSCFEAQYFDKLFVFVICTYIQNLSPFLMTTSACLPQ